MKIRKSDESIFETKYLELEKALSELGNDEMIEIPLLPDEVKKWRSTSTNKARKLGVVIATKYDEQKHVLYIRVLNHKVRDVKIAIEILEMYPKYSDIVRQIKKISMEE